LFAGVAPLTPTAGSGTAAMMADIGNMLAALASHSAGKTAVIIAALPQAVTPKLTAGPKFDFDIIASPALATGTTAVIGGAGQVSGFGSADEFSASKVGVVHAEDTTPTTGGTPSPASPVKSGRACAMASRSNVVTWTDDDRSELAELCRVHDQMMAE